MQERFVGFIVAMAAIDVERGLLGLRSKVCGGGARVAKRVFLAR